MRTKATTLGIWALAAAGWAYAALWLAQGGADNASRQVDQVIGVHSGARGTEGDAPPKPGVTQVLPTPPPPDNTAEGIRRGTSSIEPINRQEGVTTITLQNLEVVLRMQSRTPPPPPKGGGGKATATTAAKLLQMEAEEPPPEQEVKDDRAIDAQFRQQVEEGS